MSQELQQEIDRREDLRSLAQAILDNNDSSAGTSEVYDSVLIKFHNDGAEGASCYSSRRAQHYEKDISEKLDSIDFDIKNHIASDIEFDFSAYNDLVYNAVEQNNYIESNSDNSDYYGNYSNYHTVAISMEDFLECFAEEKDREVFTEEFDECCGHKLKAARIQKVKQNISSLESSKKAVEKSIEEHDKEMDRIEAAKRKEKADLEAKLAAINNYLDNAPKNRKAHYDKKLNDIHGFDVKVKIAQEELDMLEGREVTRKNKM